MRVFGLLGFNLPPNADGQTRLWSGCRHWPLSETLLPKNRSLLYSHAVALGNQPSFERIRICGPRPLRFLLTSSLLPLCRQSACLAQQWQAKSGQNRGGSLGAYDEPVILKEDSCRCHWLFQTELGRKHLWVTRRATSGSIQNTRASLVSNQVC